MPAKSSSIVIQSKIGGGPWTAQTAIWPLKGQKVELRVDQESGDGIRWYEIFADLSRTYKNANHPWESNPYKWVGFAKIEYFRRELVEFRGRRKIEPFTAQASEEFAQRVQASKHELDRLLKKCRYYHRDAGSFWFQVEVSQGGRILRSAGIEDSDHRGLSPAVFRVSVRDGPGYIGYLSSFLNVPGLFGSISYQSNNYIGVDCADAVVAAYGWWKGGPVEKNYNVNMLVREWPKVCEFEMRGGMPRAAVSWQKDVRRGDLIAVGQRSTGQYGHIGALLGDSNGNGILDGLDQVIHAGPTPLRYSYLSEGSFDGHVVILRP